MQHLLTAQEVDCLRHECYRLHADLANQGIDLCNQDCMLEPDGNLPPEGAPARTDAESYLQVRCKAHCARSREIMEGLLMHKLPSAVLRVLGYDDLDSIAASCCPLLFNEHYVVKPSRRAGRFAWHTDAAHQHEAALCLGGPSNVDSDALLEYVSFWCPLDDIDSTNGALVLLPRSAPQPPFPWQTAANDQCEAWLRRHADGHAHAALVHAGDAVIFSSRLWHCSEPNTSAADRRVFYCQYSMTPIGGDSPLACAVRTSPRPAMLEESGVAPIDLPRARSGEDNTEPGTASDPQRDARRGG
uniref:Phytanoyl-CoA dioxygenase n=1 Tax=Chrysotila carterae TaxID=13221 RepID=A0A7S4BER3_CHRCT